MDVTLNESADFPVVILRPGADALGVITIPLWKNARRPRLRSAVIHIAGRILLQCPRVDRLVPTVQPTCHKLVGHLASLEW
jgi:hypothetical protein